MDSGFLDFYWIFDDISETNFVNYFLDFLIFKCQDFLMYFSYLRGSHGMSARWAQRTKSRGPKVHTIHTALQCWTCDQLSLVCPSTNFEISALKRIHSSHLHQSHHLQQCQSLALELIF